MKWQRVIGPMTMIVLWRAKVPGGWLVCSQGDENRAPAGLAFIPDPAHEWDD